VPHIERIGEDAIARDAATLRKKALDRIAQLEAAGGSPGTGGSSTVKRR
jgi:hypothetical protein